MSDEQIVEYARKWIDEKDIHGWKELIKADRGLYIVF